MREYKLLSGIHSPSDVKKLREEELPSLAREIRDFLVEHILETGGHLASNLGVVELTIALHRVFSSPEDKIVFDVGHQSYVHKILTGRLKDFSVLRKKGGISGFPKPSESPYDAFATGHASTSISAAYGLAKARDLQGKKHAVIAVIGDGSLSGGLAYEGMNNAGKDKTNLIIVLNDNEMSIGKSVGSLSLHLNRLRTARGYLKGKKLFLRSVSRYPALRPLYHLADRMKNRIKYLLLKGILFEEMGLTYLGPVNGHDIAALSRAFREARRLSEPVIIHVTTKKGKGYRPAEEDPDAYHGISPVKEKKTTYAEVFSRKLNQLSKKDRRITAITAAMAGSVGLQKDFEDKKRLFDVGIAESHAVTFAAGLAQGGMRPAVVIYASFLQRAYDQILHDVALTSLPVIFGVDHSGVVGEDGETHQGIFALAYLTHIPNLMVLCPSSAEEMRLMLSFAVQADAPSAICYPKGAAFFEREEHSVFSAAEAAEPAPEKEPVIKGKARVRLEVKSGREPVTILGLGTMVEASMRAAKALAEKNIPVRVVDLRFASPIDEALITKCLLDSALALTVEEAVGKGGAGEQAARIAEKLRLSGEKPCRLLSLHLPDAFLPQQTRQEALEESGLTALGIAKAAENAYDG